MPQQWFYLGAAISLLTLLLCISYLVYDYFKNKPKPNVPNYEGHNYTEAMFELHHKGKLSKEETEEYLKREYNPKEVKLLLKDLRKK